MRRDLSVTALSYTDVVLPLLWAAPEIIDSRKYTVKSDVWSFAVLMVELFQYGEQPYAGIFSLSIHSSSSSSSS